MVFSIFAVALLGASLMLSGCGLRIGVASAEASSETPAVPSQQNGDSTVVFESQLMRSYSQDAMADFMIANDR